MGLFSRDKQLDESGIVEAVELDEGGSPSPSPTTGAGNVDLEIDDDDYDDDDESGIPPPPPPPPPLPPIPSTTKKSSSSSSVVVGPDGVDGGKRRGRNLFVASVLVVVMVALGLGLGLGLGLDRRGGTDASANEAVDGGGDVADGGEEEDDDDDVVVGSTSTVIPTSSPSTSSSDIDGGGGEPPSCPSVLDLSYVIDEYATFYYAVVPPYPEGSGNGLLCGRLEAIDDDDDGGGGWVGIGFSSDGLMAGSSAVIGLPSDGTVLKYDLTDAATLMSDDRQTLSGTSLEVVSGEGGDGAANMVVMEFVKLLVEDGEVPISEYGNNNFIHARGTSELGYHTGRFAFVIDFGDEVAVSDDVTSDETVYDAIVIGAGWAGIRAIETLASEGVSKFLVLEATDRVGGRCRTESWGDGTTNDPNVDPAEQVYDLGADWLYSGTDMSDALDDGGYLDDAVLGGPLDTSMPLGLGYGTFYRQYKNDDDEVGGVTAEALDDAVSSENMDTLWGGFHEFRDNRLDEMGGMSYEEAIDWYIQRWGYTDDEALDFLDLIEASVEVENAGDSSMLDINEIKFFPPGYAVDSYYMSVPGAGFGNIAARYAAQYSSSIRLNSRVVDVDSEAEPDVAVVTYVGEDGVTRVVKAKTVLVTVSLGVLKAGTVNFVPALPENKLASIEAMGFGTINKCILSWNDDAAMVWPEDEMWFMLITPDEETSGRWTTFFNPSSLKGKPSLTSFVAGEDAVAMEGQSDEEVLEDVMTNLRSMFPDISDPDRVIVTRWGVEEDFMGAHSYPVPGRDIAEDAANLSETYGRIYFAGEATGNRWGTTLGAWNTGEEQALAMAQRLMGG